MLQVQSVLREMVTEQLLAATKLDQKNQARDYQSEVLDWLDNTGEALKRLRHPLAGMVAAKSALVTAASQGYRPDGVAEQTSRRNAVRVTCALIVDEITAELASIVSDTDKFFTEMADRMAQLLAVATPEAPIPLPPTEPRSAWLDKVWLTLGQNSATGSMHAYLGARLSRTDRHYLLDDLIGNMAID